MSGERAPLFGQDTDLDLSSFRPKAPPMPEKVRDVAEHVGFRSREAAPPAAATATLRREPRRYRTGRNIQLNLKVRQEAIDAFYKIADEQGWVLGEAFEQAVSALAESLQKANRYLKGA